MVLTMPTVEERKLKFIGRQTDKVRNAVIDFYIEPPNAPGPRQRSGMRHLIVRYESGGAKDLPIVDGKREFAAGIPDGWTEDQVLKKVEGDYGALLPISSQTKQ
jgi:hypothetical protein